MRSHPRARHDFRALVWSINDERSSARPIAVVSDVRSEVTALSSCSVIERRHHLVVRVTHWVNALALTIMITSGLRIFNSYPAFARKGETFCCYPFEGHTVPVWLTFGGWLAGASTVIDTGAEVAVAPLALVTRAVSV